MSLKYEPSSEPLQWEHRAGELQAQVQDLTAQLRKLKARTLYLFIDNLLVRIQFIIVMIRWTGLAPWEFEFPFPGSLISTFLSPYSTSRACHRFCPEYLKVNSSE